MSIENELARIATALETLAGADAPKKPSASAAQGKGASASKSTSKGAGTRSKPSQKPTTKAEGSTGSSDDGPKLTDVRKALASLQKREDAAAAKDVLKEVGGAATLSKLDPDKYQDVIDAAAE